MANEILSLGGDGNGNQSLLFVYPIAAPAVITGTSTKVVPTPSEGLPALAATVLDAQTKTDLDAGDKAFETVSFALIPGMTNPQLLAAAQSVYARRKADFEARYAVIYRQYGTLFNAE